MLPVQVTAAIAKQLATLNTNARYLHRGVVDFAEEVAATLPPELSVPPVCWCTQAQGPQQPSPCSGS